MSDCGCETAYPDNAWSGDAEVIENVQLAEGTYRVRFVCPEVAAAGRGLIGPPQRPDGLRVAAASAGECCRA